MLPLWVEAIAPRLLWDSHEASPSIERPDPELPVVALLFFPSPEIEHELRAYQGVMADDRRAPEKLRIKRAVVEIEGIAFTLAPAINHVGAFARCGELLEMLREEHVVIIEELKPVRSYGRGEQILHSSSAPALVINADEMI
jgi:hypothetical protein